MDHHGLLVLPEGLVIVGGMEKGQQVTSKVVVLAKQAAAAAAPKPLAGK
jgi:hypothetical protein